MSRYLGKITVDDTFLNAGKNLAFKATSGGGSVQLKAPAGSISSNIQLTLPSAYGTLGQGLGTDASGNLSYYDYPIPGGNDPTGPYILGTAAASSEDAYLQAGTSQLRLANASGNVTMVAPSAATVAPAVVLPQADNAAAVTVKAADSGVTSYTVTLPAVAPTLADQALAFTTGGVASFKNYALQSGNTLGAALAVGTKDAFDFTMRANNTERLAVTSAGQVTVLGSTNPTPLRFNQGDNSKYVGVEAPAAITASYTIKWPIAAPGNNTHLVANATGQMDWATTIAGAISYLESASTTANATLDNTYNIWPVDATAGNVALTGPVLTSAPGIVYQLIKTDASANTVTFAPQTGDSLDGVVDGTVTLDTQNARVGIFATTSGWFTM